MPDCIAVKLFGIRVVVVTKRVSLKIGSFLTVYSFICAFGLPKRTGFLSVRDTGLSSHLDHLGSPSPIKNFVKQFIYMDVER